MVRSRTSPATSGADRSVSGPSLQSHYSPASRCFGCGPASRPTPTAQPVHLRAWPVETHGDRVVVDAELSSGGIITATCRGTFVAVGPDHPAFDRW